MLSLTTLQNKWYQAKVFKYVIRWLWYWKLNFLNLWWIRARKEVEKLRRLAELKFQYSESPLGKLVLPAICFTGSIFLVWKLFENQSCHRQRTLWRERQISRGFHNHMYRHVRLEEESKHMASFLHETFAKNCGSTKGSIVDSKRQNEISYSLTEFRNQIIR